MMMLSFFAVSLHEASLEAVDVAVAVWPSKAGPPGRPVGGAFI